MNRNKWQEWHDNLPNHTKEWLKKQPLWHDKDLAFVGAICLVIGYIIGWLS